MSKLTQLKRLRTLYERRERLAAQAYAHTHRAAESQHQRAVDMARFRDDYINKAHEQASGQAGQPGGAANFYELALFLGQVDTARDLAEKNAADLHQQSIQRKAQWSEARQKTLAIETILTKRENEAKKRARLREQHDLWELLHSRASDEAI